MIIHALIGIYNYLKSESNKEFDFDFKLFKTIQIIVIFIQ